MDGMEIFFFFFRGPALPGRSTYLDLLCWKSPESNKRSKKEKKARHFLGLPVKKKKERKKKNDKSTV